MAVIQNQNPGSSEVQSPLIAGIVEALNKISYILSLNTATVEDSKLSVVNIEGEETGRIFEAQEGKRLWLSSPAPTFKKNGSAITPESDNFSIDYVGGSITFDGETKPSKSDNITVSCTYISNTSAFLTTLSNEIDEAKQLSNRYKGSFESLDNLQSQLPTSTEGDFAFVKDEIAFYVFTGGTWKNTQSIEDLSNYYNKSEVDNFLSQKEGSISVHGSESTDDDYYFGGRKTWQSLQSKVLAVQLVGLSLDDDSDIQDGDTLLQIIGKIASTIDKTEKKNYISGTGEPTTETAGEVGQRFVNQSNGNSYICVSASVGNYVWKKEVSRDEFETEKQNVSNKVDKVSSATDDNIATFSSGGNIQDSGKKLSDYVESIEGKGLSTNDYTNEDKDLVDTIPEKASVSTWITSTLESVNWTGDQSPFSLTLQVEGVTADSNQEILPTVDITAEQLTAYQSANIQDGGQAAGSITLKAFGAKPEVDIPIRIMLRGD